MTKLDIVLERVRQLPQDQQDAIAADLQQMLEGSAEEIVLTPEQDAELSRRLADQGKTYVSHEDVAALFTQKYGR